MARRKPLHGLDFTRSEVSCRFGKDWVEDNGQVLPKKEKLGDLPALAAAMWENKSSFFSEFWIIRANVCGEF
jgi:hypothetical protein